MYTGGVVAGVMDRVGGKNVAASVSRRLLPSDQDTKSLMSWSWYVVRAATELLFSISPPHTWPLFPSSSSSSSIFCSFFFYLANLKLSSHLHNVAFSPSFY